jgi:hypothetical protein
MTLATTTDAAAGTLPAGQAGPPANLAGPMAYDPSSPTRFFSLAYYQDQIVAFQNAVTALDQAAQHVTDLLTLETLDDQSRTELQAWIDDFNGKKFEIRAAAMAINAVADTAQAVGFNVPNVTLPQSLGFAPLAIVGLAAAVAAAAAVVAWSIQAIAVAQQTTEQVKLRLAAIANLPVADQEKLLAAEQGIAAARASAEAGAGGTLSTVATIIKWVAIGAALWFAYRACQDFSKGGRREAAGA